jgi:hypothetical protein
MRRLVLAITSTVESGGLIKYEYKNKVSHVFTEGY